ncbi:reverse transcriptase domain-containing protein [Streptomyces sp. NPDC086010]|uniref:reverse transcriptase domain-containing protein n=1 Tax=Streptomyces sp. NPDC086010 TaxID=3365745 RepID=UPI0037D7728E
MRILGIPAVADRVAQTVVARHLMRRVEPVFHPDSFGYRPGRSALNAVERCRERCWKRDWVVEFDIAKFFDSALGPPRQGGGRSHRCRLGEVLCGAVAC